MRKIAAVLCLSIGLGVSGCATTGGGATADPTIVAQVQADAKAICGFLPTATTVANVITTFTGGGAVVNVVSQVAAGICAAVTNKGARRGGARYRGVKIKGRFVR